VKLTAALEDPITEQKSTIVPTSVIVNSKEEWEVKEILNSQWCYNMLGLENFSFLFIYSS